ncbi:hypothetical protein RCG23_09745 [Neobacillus sp. PS3-34]|uniref:hypothetical protein n=1 Tax=Neobacillus sp. PS3-34 TaxID=3070678 RepID=UPI0027E04A93|nr:hypothetical protein [Neobacillus sp. PS3-34]WML50095.1 hypothetical protein RCG23_09745 [Neobacillus sp. PS3-34]
MNNFQSRMPDTYGQAQQYALPRSHTITNRSNSNGKNNNNFTNGPSIQNESQEVNINQYKPKDSKPLIFTPPKVRDQQIMYKQIDYEESEDYLLDESEDEINSSELETQFLMQLSEQKGNLRKEKEELKPSSEEDKKEKVSFSDGIHKEEYKDHRHLKTIQDESSSSSKNDSTLNEDLVKKFTAMLEESSSYTDESSSSDDESSSSHDLSSSLEESSSSHDESSSPEESSSSHDESSSPEESSSSHDENSSLEESSSSHDESSSPEESSSSHDESSSPEESSSSHDESSSLEESSSSHDESSSLEESSSSHDESSSLEESSSSHDESSSPEESSSSHDESSSSEESSSSHDESSSLEESSSSHDESSSPEESSSSHDESSSLEESSSSHDESSSLEESSSSHDESSSPEESSSSFDESSSLDESFSHLESEESSSSASYLDKDKDHVHPLIVRIPVLLSLLKVDIDIYDSFNLFVPISSVIKVNWSINSLDCKVLLPTPNVFLKGELIADIEYVKDNVENTLHSIKIIVPYEKVIVAEWLHSPNLPSTHQAEYMFVSPDRQEIQYHREFTQQFAEPVYCELHGIQTIWHDELISKDGKPELDVQGKGTLTISLLQSQYVDLNIK